MYHINLAWEHKYTKDITHDSTLQPTLRMSAAWRGEMVFDV